VSQKLNAMVKSFVPDGKDVSLTTSALVEIGFEERPSTMRTRFDKMPNINTSTRIYLPMILA